MLIHIVSMSVHVLRQQAAKEGRFKLEISEQTTERNLLELFMKERQRQGGGEKVDEGQ